MARFLATLQDPRRWTAVIFLVALLGIVWIWQSAAPASATTGGLAPSPREGFPAPDFTLPTMNRGAITLSSLHGQVVVINLWTAWCPPCREEMPAIEQVYRQYRDQGLTVLAVNSTFQDDEGAAAAFVQELSLTFPVLLDRDGVVSRRYQLQALPTTFFVDRRGLIRDVVLGGPMEPALIESKVRDLLAERARPHE